MGYEVITGDCLEAMRTIPDGSIDACVTDPPYGTTACSWDSVIPFAPMWAELKRIVKRNGAMVLFGSQPFTSALVMSNPQMFSYEWMWDKVNKYTNFLNAKRQPMRRHESVLVFSQSRHVYNPQMVAGKPYISRRSVIQKSESYGQTNGVDYGRLVELQHPCSVLSVPSNETVDVYHPNQKPLELMRYLIRTYTNEGDTVLDFTCGSGSTGVACVIEKRNFTGIESDENYADIARARIQRAQGIACDIPRRVNDRPLPLFANELALEINLPARDAEIVTTD